MKTKLNGKTIKAIKLLALLLPLTTLAADKESRETRVADSLVGQIGVTRDALQQVVTKMKNSIDAQGGSSFSNPDFVAMANAFNTKVDKSMVQFEAEVQPLLKQAYFYAERLKTIELSAQYTKEQKAALLDAQTRQAQVAVEDLSKKYIAAIEKLYILGLPRVEIVQNKCDVEPYTSGWSTSYQAVLNVKVKLYGSLSGSQKEIILQKSEYGWNNAGSAEAQCPKFKEWAITAASGINLYGDEIRQVVTKSDYLESVHQFILADEYSGCMTNSCLSLYAAHRIAYLKLIEATIDRSIEVYRGARRSDSLVIGKFDGYNINILDHLVGDSEKTRRIAKVLGLTPGDGKDLPFDISEVDYKKALRNKKIDALKAALLTPGGGWFSSWACSQEVASLKGELCSTEGFCLNEAEMRDIIQTIQSSDLGSKSDRIDCFRK